MNRSAERVVRLLVAGLLASSTALAAPQAPQPNTPPAKAPPAAAAPAKAVSILPSDADLQRIVDDRVATFHDSVGLIVGVVEPAGRRLFARGPAQVGNDEAVDGDTIYEIGAVSKTFTGLLLTEAARRGELTLTDPVTKYLPPGSTVPQRGRPITLLDLATHTSGLPKMPGNVAATDLNHPNAEMSADQLLKSVAVYDLSRDVGSAYEYSDAGYELLGMAIVAAGHTDYDTLLKSRILAPLHMTNTHLAQSLEEKPLLSVGYDAHLTSVPHAHVPLVPGAAGMRSTANDLLNFVAANIGLANSPLTPAMADTLKTKRQTQYLELQIAIGWHVATLHGVEMVWENGQTDGYRAFIGFVPKARTGVVVLSNAANTIDDIGAHILDPATPLRRLHREVEVKPAEFDNYLGRYVVSETFALNVTRDGNHLYIQGTGQPRAELFAEGDGQFFVRVVDGEVAFQTDTNGRARSLSLTQDGKTVSAQLLQ